MNRFMAEVKTLEILRQLTLLEISASSIVENQNTLHQYWDAAHSQINAAATPAPAKVPPVEEPEGPNPEEIKKLAVDGGVGLAKQLIVLLKNHPSAKAAVSKAISLAKPLYDNPVSNWSYRQAKRVIESQGVGSERAGAPPADENAKRTGSITAATLVGISSVTHVLLAGGSIHALLQLAANKRMKPVDATKGAVNPIAPQLNSRPTQALMAGAFTVGIAKAALEAKSAPLKPERASLLAAAAPGAKKPAAGAKKPAAGGGAAGEEMLEPEFMPGSPEEESAMLMQLVEIIQGKMQDDFDLQEDDLSDEELAQLVGIDPAALAQVEDPEKDNLLAQLQTQVEEFIDKFTTLDTTDADSYLRGFEDLGPLEQQVYETSNILADMVAPMEGMGDEEEPDPMEIDTSVPMDEEAPEAEPQDAPAEETGAEGEEPEATGLEDENSEVDPSDLFADAGTPAESAGAEPGNSKAKAKMGAAAGVAEEIDPEDLFLDA